MVNTEIRLIIFVAAKGGETLYSQQKQRLGADCGSDHELLIAKFRHKFKKVGKTSGMTIQVWPKSNPLRFYSGNDKQIQKIRSHRQSVWRTMDGSSWHHTGGRGQDHPKEKETQKGKMAEVALQIAVKRREVKSKGEKERYTHLNAEFQRIARREKKAFLSD